MGGNRHLHPFKPACLGFQEVEKTWLVSPLRIGLWDPFQMAISGFINGGDPNASPTPRCNRESELIVQLVASWTTRFFKDIFQETYLAEMCFSHFFSFKSAHSIAGTSNKKHMRNGVLPAVDQDGIIWAVIKTLFSHLFLQCPAVSGAENETTWKSRQRGTCTRKHRRNLI